MKFSAMLAAILSIPALAHADPSTTAEPQAIPSSVLDRVIASHRLRVCTTGDYKPYSFRRPDGGYEGIDIDLVNRLAASLDARIEFAPTTWKTLMKDFTAAQCDIAVGGISTTLERQRQAFFTQPYIMDGKTAIARCDDVEKYGTVAQINKPNVRAIFPPGGTNERFAKRYLTQAQLIAYPDNVTIFQQILDGRADVMVTDASETRLQQKLNPGLCSIHPDEPFEFSEKAYLLPRGDVVFQQYVDLWMHLMRSTGDLQAIMDKWLK
jgi:cyclohexadienyl dehydratase